MKRSVIVGTGYYLPETIVTNHELEKKVETSHEWIVQRTGIHQRHVAQEGELTSDLAYHAVVNALQNAGLTPQDLDAIICATSTPDESFPAVATKVQARLGMKHGFGFDLQAVCSGFVYGLSVADSMLRTGTAKRIALVGAETFTRLLDWNDRSTCVLFGDGAGAVILETQEGNGTLADRGILSTHLYSDGSCHDLLYADGGVSSNQKAGVIHMQGREIYRLAIERMGQSVDEVLQHHGLEGQDIDWFVPHQANERIIDALANRLKMPTERVIKTVQLHANTSAASVPMAFDVAVQDGRIKQGDLVLMEAFGAGLTWGAALIRV